MNLEQEILTCLAQVLGLSDTDVFFQMESHDLCHMSLPYYHSMAASPLRKGELQRINAHTDFGQITLVFQDTVGGLEVHDGSQFLPIPPIPGTVVINVGDLLERQTNGRWKSALHQVSAPRRVMSDVSDGEVRENERDETVMERFSLVFFGAPDSQFIVKTLPGCEVAGKWKPNMSGGENKEYTAGDWIAQRHAAEYDSQ